MCNDVFFFILVFVLSELERCTWPFLLPLLCLQCHSCVASPASTPMLVTNKELQLKGTFVCGNDQLLLVVNSKEFQALLASST